MANHIKNNDLMTHLTNGKVSNYWYLPTSNKDTVAAAKTVGSIIWFSFIGITGHWQLGPEWEASQAHR